MARTYGSHAGRPSWKERVTATSAMRSGRKKRGPEPTVTLGRRDNPAVSDCRRLTRAVSGALWKSLLAQPRESAGIVGTPWAICTKRRAETDLVAVDADSRERGSVQKVPSETGSHDYLEEVECKPPVPFACDFSPRAPRTRPNPSLPVLPKCCRHRKVFQQLAAVPRRSRLRLSDDGQAWAGDEVLGRRRLRS